MKDKSNTSHVEYRQFIHDLKNSICGIDGIADIGLASDNPEMYRKCMKMIKGASQTLLDILASEKNKRTNVSSDAELGYKTIFDVQKHINNAVFPAYSIIREKQLNFEMVLDDNVPPKVVSYPLAISRILGNLVVNSARYTEKGEIRVLVSWKPDLKEKEGFLIISVSDTGAGIAENKQLDIFKPYYKVDQNSSEGEGLGLSLSKRLTELLNGRLDLKSHPGLGTEIILSIPCFTEFNSVNDEVLQLKQDADVKEKLLADIRVFVVDDNELSRKFLSYYLTREGASVDIFDSGESVLSELSRESAYDLGILDINLPGKNGFETSSIIHTINKNLPLVGLTAYCGEYSQDLIQSSGMSICLDKPISPERLIQKVLEILSGEFFLRR